ncbi:hypothetical protein Sango_0524100 [Sesamum angolense]|uniref:Transcriptional coactivator Hfi1/Transcriptional adapter 1 n=1 Tax=Sesamum angolense TaxID=2727404 RepID=A0AAE1X4W7_9LAMI|nr:hypothetical protein Sango_0524100 [Sesamum angolense]
MMVDHHFTRIDMIELKDLIYQKIGRQRAEKYFDQLHRYLGSKLSKVEFDKSCIQTIGRENITLHNRLIRSIIQNACQAKVPPQKARNVDVRVANGYPRNCLQSVYSDTFPQSPRKCRSPFYRDRKVRDRPSPLGPLGKSPSITCEETVSRIQEQQSVAEVHSLCSRPPMDITSVEDGEEVEQFSGIPSSQSWRSVTAPFGVSVNMGGRHKACRSSFSCHHSFLETCQNSGELPDTRSLRSRLLKKLASEGVGISMDSANLLNNSLDVFLKRLIERCIGVGGSRCTDPHILEKKLDSQVISGFNRIIPGKDAQVPTPTYVSMLDFRVAMESDPVILGEDWSVQLEKICHYALE